MMSDEWLWTRVVETTRRALDCGALQPAATRCESIDDSGVRFQVRIREPVDRGIASALKQRGNNPFLPYDPELFVGDLGTRHVGLLNKFPVVDHHLLVVTREFEPQSDDLTASDFAALARCLRSYASLGFYNSGPVAGASQPHRHLQVVPVRQVSDAPDVPMQPKLASLPLSGPMRNPASLPFEHWGMRLAPSASTTEDQLAEQWREAYCRIRAEARELTAAEASPLDRAANDGRQDDPHPYNLLVTRNWLLYVPRRRECVHGISCNAMAFAGALLVHGQEQWQRLREQGPMTALCHVGFARH